MDACVPHIDWSQCADDTGYPRVLPFFYVTSSIVYGITGILYMVSMVGTLRTQYQDKKRFTYNTAMQMHVGVVSFCATAICHDAALVTQTPGMPVLPLLLLYHLRLLCVAFVTTVLVRHWAGLYQKMTKNQRDQQQLNHKIARFVELYRDGEVIEAVLICSFFAGTIVYGYRNQEKWEQVERLRFLVWAIVSAINCWLVTILGQRVYVNMGKVSQSRAMIGYVRRVYYVSVGSALLWCQCTVCFALGAALDRPMSAGAWLIIHSGINATGFGVGFIYYLVIGSKIAAKTAIAITSDAAAIPGEGVKKLQETYKMVANLVSLGATSLVGTVSAISDQIGGEGTIRRVFVSDEDSVRSGTWGGTWRRGVPSTGARSGQGSTGERSSNWKDAIYDPLDEEAGEGAVGLDGEGKEREEKREQDSADIWETPVRPMRGTLERDSLGGGGGVADDGTKGTPSREHVAKPELSVGEDRVDEQEWTIVDQDSGSPSNRCRGRSVSVNSDRSGGSVEWADSGGGSSSDVRTGSSSGQHRRVTIEEKVVDIEPPMSSRSESAVTSSGSRSASNDIRQSGNASSSTDPSR